MTTATRGAVSGFLATGPMTYALFSIFPNLPKDEKSALPPATITDDFFKMIGEKLGDELIVPTTIAAHFGYGAATAIPYSVFLSDVKAPLFLKGAGYGVLVWALSYFGLTPSLDFRSQARKMPWPRNAMMVAAHLVWGASVANADERLKRDGDQMLVGRKKRQRSE